MFINCQYYCIFCILLCILLHIFYFIIREFISACFDALKLNRMVVSTDQVEYQDALQENFLKMCRELSECVEDDTLWRDVLQTCTFPGNNSQTLFTAISGASHDSSNA